MNATEYTNCCIYVFRQDDAYSSGAARKQGKYKKYSNKTRKQISDYRRVREEERICLDYPYRKMNISWWARM